MISGCEAKDFDNVFAKARCREAIIIFWRCRTSIGIFWRYKGTTLETIKNVSIPPSFVAANEQAKNARLLLPQAQRARSYPCAHAFGRHAHSQERTRPCTSRDTHAHGSLDNWPRGRRLRLRQRLIISHNHVHKVDAVHLTSGIVCSIVANVRPFLLGKANQSGFQLSCCRLTSFVLSNTE